MEYIRIYNPDQARINDPGVSALSISLISDRSIKEYYRYFLTKEALKSTSFFESRF